jgi:hypothetical protein
MDKFISFAIRSPLKQRNNEKKKKKKKDGMERELGHRRERGR